jgi:hypothetical protein
VSSTGTSTSSSRIRQDGCVTRNGHNSAFHIGVSSGVHWLLSMVSSTLLCYRIAVLHGRRMGCTVLMASAYRVRHIRQRLARPTYGRLGRPLIDEENGGIFVHLYDECTNPRKAIGRSDPVHHYGDRFSILYIMLSRFEVEAPGCEGSWLQDFAVKERLLESTVTNSISSCTKA